MRIFVIIILTFCAGCCLADCFKQFCGEKEKVLLMGITVVPAGTPPSSVSRDAGIHIFVPEIEEARDCLQNLLCAPLNGNLVQDIKNKLVVFLECKKLFALVIVPEQEISDRIIVVEILFSRVGEVTFDGQKWFPEYLFRKWMNVKTGEPLDQYKMLNNLAFLNRHPFHFTEMVLSPGEQEGTTDIDFHTKDKRPMRVYTGADNTGVKVNDTNRLFAGITFGNVFGSDLLNYQYTVSPDFHRYQAHLLAYNHYMPTNKMLMVAGTYGVINPEIVDFTNRGKSAQTIVRLQRFKRPLYERRKIFCECGFDYKYLNTNLFYEGTTQQLPILTQSVNITEFQVGYSYSNFWKSQQVSMKGEIYASFWGWLPHQSRADYEALRANSNVVFAYGRGSYGYHYRPKSKWVFSSLLRGQIATGPLLSSEQYMLGGMESVRGYQEAQFLADNAVNLNIEIFSPPFEVCKKLKDEANFVFFWDLGYGYNYSVATEEVKDQTLSGIGAGIRYHIKPNLMFRGDYGLKMNQVPGAPDIGRGYFSLVASY